MSTTLAFRLILGLLVGGVLTFSVWDRSYTELEERPTDEDTRTGMPRFRSFAAVETLPTMLVMYLAISLAIGGREMAVQYLLGLLLRVFLLIGVYYVLLLAVMVASHLWYYAYMIRNKLLDEVRRDYVLLARSKGLGRTRVLWSHCLRNVMPTVVGIMAISIPHVLSGTYVAEAVFNYPGIGLLAISSAK